MRLLLFILVLLPLLTTISYGATPEATAAVAPEKLSRAGLSDEVYVFKQEVYRRHVERGLKSGRPRIFDLPPEQLATIPGTEIPMRKDAAQALGKLLQAARADLARDLKVQGDKAVEERRARALRVKELGVNNAYRSASRQFGIWDRNFLKYYNATAEKRALCEGGSHGDRAADLLREYIGIRVAAPGFSNHQGGIAVDCALHLKAAPSLGASTEQGNAWKESWFWQWLKKRAHEFGFVEYEPEEWHWEYKPEQAAKIK